MGERGPKSLRGKGGKNLLPELWLSLAPCRGNPPPANSLKRMLLATGDSGEQDHFELDGAPGSRIGDAVESIGVIPWLIDGIYNSLPGGSGNRVRICGERIEA